MPALKPSDIHNIVLLGHSGAGKTTLAEAMLFATKVTTRLGSVTDGTSMLDSSELEKQRKHTIDPALGFVEYQGKTINFIDTPGYPDFIGGPLTCLAGGDVAVIVINAGSGIETSTRRMFKAAKALNIPVAFVVNKIDAENADLAGIESQIAETFGSSCYNMNLPCNGGKDVIDCFDHTEGQSDFSDVAACHEKLIEGVVESNEEMMETYLGGEEIPASQLSDAFGSAMCEGTLIPIFYTSATTGVGIDDLMLCMAKYFPKPGMVNPFPVTSSPDPESDEVEITADESKPFVGQAFKITTDPFVGKLAWIRILEGKITPDCHYILKDEKKGHKVGHLFKLIGNDTKEVKQAVAGDIIALAKVEAISKGDVLHESHDPMYRATTGTPTPMYSLAVNPKARGDEQKISEALHRLCDEDPTFVYSRDNQTHETVISGIGDLHLRMMLAKMKQRFNLEVDTKPPKIPYRETISMPAEGHHRHKKQTGGAGQFGEVHLRIEPLNRGEGFEYKSELFGESIPRQFLPAIEKGIHDVLSHGAIAGYPMQDIRVAITDGKHHPVDSKEVAFKAAGKHAFIDAVKKAKPVLLEPVVEMEITVPADKMGDIASDMATRRGRIQGQDMLPGNLLCIKAVAPLSEVMQYNSTLRSMTAGQGSYVMELSHYEPVPGNVQQKIIAEADTVKEEH